MLQKQVRQMGQEVLMPSDVTYPVVRGLRKRRQSLRNLSKGSVHGVVDEKTEMSGGRL